MKKIIQRMNWIFIFFLPTTVLALQWNDLWRTSDQQGVLLLQKGQAQKAAQTFKNKDWQAAAWYRAGAYDSAYKHYKNQNTSDGQYNAGNAAAYLGQYEQAIKAYDKAIALNSNNTDAITNREIIKKILKEKQQKSSNSKNSANNKKDRNKDDNSAKNQSEQPDKKPNKQAQNNNNENNSQQNDNQQEKDNSQQEKNSSQKENEGDTKENREADGEKLAQAKARSQQQTEDKKQILRRLADDPGGLLRQKFLRDYMRRHSNENVDLE